MYTFIYISILIAFLFDAGVTLLFIDFKALQAKLSKIKFTSNYSKGQRSNMLYIY